MGFYIPKGLECDFKRLLEPTKSISTIQVFSKTLDILVENILEESNLSSKSKNKLRARYKIIGIGKVLSDARGNFYLKLRETHRCLENRKRKSLTEKHIMKLYSNYIKPKETAPESS